MQVRGLDQLAVRFLSEFWMPVKAEDLCLGSWNLERVAVPANPDTPALGRALRFGMFDDQVMLCDTDSDRRTAQRHLLVSLEIERSEGGRLGIVLCCDVLLRDTRERLVEEVPISADCLLR